MEQDKSWTLVFPVAVLMLLAYAVVDHITPAHASTAPDQTENLLKQTRARAYDEGFKAGQIDGITTSREILQEEMRGSCGLMRTAEGQTWELARVSARLGNPLAVCLGLVRSDPVGTETCVCAK